MSKAKILKLKTEVTKMESVYSKSSTSDKTKAILKKAIDKAKGEIEKLEGKAAKKEPAKKEPKAAAEPKTRKKRKKATPLERLKSLVKRKKYSAYSKTGVDLEKDAGQPALPTGKRKSKSGKTYYEYRANRIDVKQPPKRYPKLAEGGETSDDKIRFDMYGYIHANDQTQDGDEIIRVSSYKEAEEKAEKYLKENKYELVELYRKDDFVGSIRTKKNFVYSSRYKKEDFADGGSVAKLKTKLDFDINEVVSDVISKINSVKSSEDDYNYMIDGVVNKLLVVQFTLLNKKEPTNIPAKKEGSNSVLNAEIDKIVSDVLAKVKAAQNSPEQYKFMVNNIIDKLRKYKKEYGGYMADGGNTYLNLSEDERMEVKNLKALIEETMEAIEVHEKQAEKSDNKESKKYHESRVKDLKQVLENRKGRLARLTSRKFASGGYMADGGRVMPFLKFEYATESRKKLDKGQLPVFEGGIGFSYSEKEKKLYYLPSVVGDWKEVGHFKSKKEAIDWLSEQLKMEGFADGGQIKDQYDGREPEDIWNNLSKMQRQHFLFDHADEIEIRRGNGELSGKEISDITKMEYSKLDSDIKKSFANHVREGQYKGGGSLDIDSYADGGELKKDYLVTFDSQTQDFQPTTFQASSIYDLMQTLRETVPAEVEILSIEQMTPHGVMEYGGVAGY